MKRTELIVALDYPDLSSAMQLVDAAGTAVQWYKVGKQLFTQCGPQVLQELKCRSKKVFLDMKYHDIPNTVAGAVRSAAAIGADIINVHASGGLAMMEAAARVAGETGRTVIAVTVLTSMDAAALKETGIAAPPGEQVVRLALLAQRAGLAGVVCSPREIEAVHHACGNDFLTVVPGIRPAGAALGDQKRVMTPAEAHRAGADCIVVGRPITAAADPCAAARAILSELDEA